MVFFESIAFNEQAVNKAKLEEPQTGTLESAWRVERNERKPKANRFEQAFLLLAYAHLHRLF